MTLYFCLSESRLTNWAGNRRRGGKRAFGTVAIVRGLAFLAWLYTAEAAPRKGTREPIKLCQASHEHRRERAFAEYQAATPSPDIDEFLAEWQQDLHEEDTKRYQPLRVLGRGFQGSVVAAKDLATKQVVAIKQVKDAFGKNSVNGVRPLRELTYLRMLNNSEYTTDILHAFLPKAPMRNFTTVYFVMELMDMPLKGQASYAQFRALPVDKQKIMLHDILTGLSDMHDAGIYHRDIGVRNIMANVDCKFKIIDFGLSAPSMPNFEGHVYTYPDNRGIRIRPPELMPFGHGLNWRESYEIWMMGCAFLRLMLGTRAEVCKTTYSHVQSSEKPFREIIRLLGMPSKSTLLKYNERGRRVFEANRPGSAVKPIGFAREYRRMANTEVLGFVEKMMELDPDRRPSAAHLLQDPVFAGITRAKGLTQETKKTISQSHQELKMRKGFKSRDYRLLMYLEILNNYIHPSDGGTPAVASPRRP